MSCRRSTSRCATAPPSASARSAPRTRRSCGHFLDGLSAESRWLRFFCAGADLDRAAPLAALEPRRGRGLVAVAGRPGADRRRTPPTSASAPDRAEVAFEVADERHGRGIATILLAHLAELAPRDGIDDVRRRRAPDNHRMAQVFRDSGFAVEVSVAPGELRVRVPGLARRRGAARASRTATGSRRWPPSRTCCGPASVAVIGASTPPGLGRRGAARATCARPASAARSPSSIPRRTASAACPPTARSRTCPARRPGRHRRARPRPWSTSRASAGPPASARSSCSRPGSPRSGGRGARPPGRAARGLPRQRHAARRPELPRRAQHGADVAAQRDLRARSRRRPAASPSPRRAAPSGSRRSPRPRAAASGLSSFVSTGDKADLSGNDFLRFWEQDDDTDVVGLYLESFGNPRRFGRIARAVAARKPIVAVKSGRSAAGARAAASHTGALLAASDVHGRRAVRATPA